MPHLLPSRRYPANKSQPILETQPLMLKLRLRLLGLLLLLFLKMLVSSKNLQQMLNQ